MLYEVITPLMTDSPAIAAVALYAGLNAMILGWLAAHIGRLSYNFV